jgi:aminoglycoside phosphotransferase (APT) family kinase protein
MSSTERITRVDDHTDFARYLPAERFGDVREIVPISVGLSGAGVYAVSAESGEYVLRIIPSHETESWTRQITVMRLASEHGIAPSLALVDDQRKVTVSTRIVGPPFGAVLLDPAARDRAIASLVEQLAKLHALPADSLGPSDPPEFALQLWRAQSVRPGFPRWALPFADELHRCAEALARDPRRVLSHNDLNPGNVVWDGTRVWLIDWSVSAIGHPYYDLATISMFLLLGDESALALLAAQEGAPPSEAQAETFRALRRTAAILCGLMFLKLTPDDAMHAPDRPEDTQSLAQCYGRMRSGTFDLQSGAGQCAFGLALLRTALS